MDAHSLQNSLNINTHEVLDSLPLATALFSPTGDILFTNQFFASSFDLSVEQMHLQNLAQFSEECFQVFSQNVLRFRQGLSVEPFEYQVFGRYYWVILKPNYSINGELQSVLLCSSDISNLMHKKIQFEASNLEFRRGNEKDHLTGLANRRAFDLKLKHYLHAITQHEASELSLLLVDVDNFKKMNDLYGQSLGDNVLKALARTLSNVSPIEVSQHIYRVGGEEFAILLPNFSLQQGCEQAEIYRSAVEILGQHFRGQILHELSISVGVVSTREFMFAQSFYELANKALFCAKKGLKNCVYYTNHNGCYSYPKHQRCQKGECCI